MHTHHSPKTQADFISSLFLFIAALSVGWLVGLSTSPVLQVIVGSAIAVIVAIVGALSGLRTPIDVTEKEQPNTSATSTLTSNAVSVNAVPIAVFAIGLAIGSTVGVVARTNEIFGTNQEKFIQRWQGVGLTNVEVKRRLFDQLYPPVPADRGEAREHSDSKGSDGAQGHPDGASQRGNVLAAGLFTAPVQDCQLLTSKQGDELRTRLLAVGGKTIERALKQCRSDECLEALRAFLCGN